jgi:glucose/mannose transport system substrate-binding protein
MLGKMFTDAGGQWESVAAPGAAALLAKLRSDIVAGNPPQATTLKGADVAEWNSAVGLVDVNEVANAEKWDDVIVPALKDVLKQGGNWIAVPGSAVRINWIYGNKAAMDRVGLTELPKTWADFNAACEKAIATGEICLAHSSSEEIDQMLLEAIVYGQDIDLYRKAFVDGDLDALRSPEMVRALDQMRLIISKYTDPAIAGRSYDASTQMNAKGEAVFFLQGDWQIAKLLGYGLEPGKDVLCGQGPTDWGKPGFVITTDSTVFFKHGDPDVVEGQKLLAHLLMSPEFQAEFAMLKRNLPARLDVDLKGANACQQLGLEELRAASEAGTVVGSLSQNWTLAEKYRQALAQVATEFANTPEMTSQDAANEMADVVEAQM